MPGRVQTLAEQEAVHELQQRLAAALQQQSQVLLLHLHSVQRPTSTGTETRRWCVPPRTGAKGGALMVQVQRATGADARNIWPDSFSGVQVRRAPEGPPPTPGARSVQGEHVTLADDLEEVAPPKAHPEAEASRAAPSQLQGMLSL